MIDFDWFLSLSLMDCIRIVVFALIFILAFQHFRRRKTKLMLPLSRGWFKAIKRPSRRDLCVKVGIGIALAFITLMAISLADILTIEHIGQPVENPSVHPVSVVGNVSLWLLLPIAIIMPIFETWAFCDILLKKLLKHGVVFAVLVSALAFSFVHVMEPGTTFAMMVPMMVAGVIFGVTYVKWGFLAAAIAHSGANALTIAIVMLI